MKYKTRVNTIEKRIPCDNGVHIIEDDAGSYTLDGVEISAEKAAELQEASGSRIGGPVYITVQADGFGAL